MSTNRQISWTNLSFITFTHVVAVFGVVYLSAYHFSWWTIGLGCLWFAFCGVSITGGYHRMFSHSAYKGSTFLKAFYLLFGAASVQNSVLCWAGDHRIHHAHTDDDRDPYNISRGFWWAHIGWIFFRSEAQTGNVKDLAADPLVMFQHRYYVPLAILAAVGIPGLIGLAWGDALGAVLIAGFLRLVIQWHATFSVNSLTHMIGRQPFSTKTSARDSFWLGLITLGESYHNFHHRFQTDFRNGIRWYHFDPTKWWIWTMAKLGFARDLRRISTEKIEAARIAVRAAGLAPSASAQAPS